MQFAINVPNFGGFSDARLMAELAHEAEDAGWDGICPLKGSYQVMQPDDIREMLTYIRQFRTSDEPFEILAAGNTSGKERQKDLDIVTPYAEAGAT